jgi:pimeloyl-ACP methyl ester carboxylesterase
MVIPMTVELAHTSHGSSGPPLVILHGLLGSARNWNRIARQLALTHRVFALDLRNHGASPWADPMTYAQMALDVCAFLDRQELPAASLIGHSMGGKVAMRLALGHGQRVLRLVVVDIAPVTYRRDFHEYLAAMQRLDLAALGRRAEADAALARDIDDAGVRGFLLQNLVSAEGKLAWRVPLAALADAMPELMGFPHAPDKRYDGPALFLSGGRSRYVRQEHHEEILRLFPQARFAVIEDAGHWVQAEAPESFLELVQDFLA